MGFDGLPVLDEPTTTEEGSDDGWALYLLWRFVRWRHDRGLPDVDLDDADSLKTLVAELEDLFGDLLVLLRSGAVPSPQAP
jgi:hypothetical protein